MGKDRRGREQVYRTKRFVVLTYFTVINAIVDLLLVNNIAKKHSLSWETIKDWIRKYKDGGLEGLKESNTWKRYDHAVKQEAVLAVINKKMSILEATLL